jgi:(1->4)-alpha-D-glucan 1-alpha-D-glucosylmutase
VSAFDILCELAGIGAEYADIWGRVHRPSEDTRRALLAEMGVMPRGVDPQSALEAWKEYAASETLPPVTVVREEALPYRWPLRVVEERARETHRWKLELEIGETRSAEVRPADLSRINAYTVRGVRRMETQFQWHERLPPGYHRFTLQEPDGAVHSMRLVVVPPRCYLPPVLEDEGRIWGPALQLYAVRSGRNWGIGDFGDLCAIIEQWGERGAAIVGVNPLHALYPANPAHASPYSPSSRLFLNVLYIDVEAVEDYRECPDACAPDLESRLQALRAADLVDYPGVAAAKLPVLERLYVHFRARHLVPGTVRGDAFRQFQRQGGEALRRHALFEALYEHFRADSPGICGWQDWPEAYRDPGSAAVTRFAAERLERVEFYEYLQWQTDLQLARAAERSLELDLAVGLYQDLAVSIDRGGAEAWANQDLYALRASIGAPPDDFNLAGQDWGLPPMRPHRLRAAAYEPFIATLRAGMRHAGALRIDHVMGLARLYWIAPGGRPADGAYVHYPFEDLLGIAALESHRNRCMVIGEDLGTVPDEIRARLEQWGVLSYRLLYFERSGTQDFKSPSAYPVNALVAASTHDLPTLAGYWEGRDIELRRALDLFPNEAVWQAQVIGRAQDRARLLIALEKERLLPPGASADPGSLPAATPEFALAVHEYLARTPSRVLMVQPEDVLGVREQANLPGTTTQYPNWKRKLPLALEEIAGDPRFLALTGMLARVRPGPGTRRAAGLRRVSARIPRATYRLQLNREFTFRQAAEIVPYLAALGISHVYCSPYLRARAGSLHGYDIVDHQSINPEIGSPEDFEHFVSELRRHGMGQILDVVPNHMGIMGADNSWWLDVLENGPSSAYADFFDIDWQPVNVELTNKVLVPVLGDHYGSVLERGELRIVFDEAGGSFSIAYHEHRFPVDPREYPRILDAALATDEGRRLPDETRAELLSLSAAFGHLPAREDTVPERLVERRRDKELHKQRLTRLMGRLPGIRGAIEHAVRTLNGVAGERASFRSLHELLEAQAYRLAYWRVASDEINYRRFFDINTLAALRMENEKVFEAAHCFVLDLAAAGKVDGLRIDHPDGLYDPAQYFRRLQEDYARRSGFGLVPHEDGHPERPLYVVIEKIAAHHEYVPESWAVHGTTGYRFLSVVNGLFVESAARRRFDRIYRAFVPDAADFEEVAYQAKMSIMRTALASELTVLATELLRIARSDWRTRDYTFNTLRRVLAEIVACFPVYRTYIADRVSPQDRRYIDWAVAQARRRSRDAEASAFEFVRGVLLAQTPPGAPSELARRCLAFAGKFQQFTAPVAAKGVEDTAFYRYNRLVSLNEVGSDPRTFGVSVAAFHQASLDRARNWPHTMLTTSTHDCKRSEDVRMRVNALSELPREWADKLRRWRRLTRSKKRRVEDQPAPSPNDEYLIYQTLLGTWPLEDRDAAALAAYRERIQRYFIKALREAKTHTSWMNVNEEYEAAVAGFVAELLRAPERNPFLADFVPFARRVARIGLFNSLSQVVIKTGSPGVPDFYQGVELWQWHLVDPDNRAPVDYALRRRCLEQLKKDFSEPDPNRIRALVERIEDGHIKLYVTWKALEARRRLEALFSAGDYIALETAGVHGMRLCAFARTHDAGSALIVAPRLIAPLVDRAGAPMGAQAWSDTVLVLPDGLRGSYRNVFTGEQVGWETTGEVPVSQVLGNFPVALFVRANA